MRALLRFATGLTLAFIYLPLIVIALYAFNERRTQTWPIPGWTLDWFEKAWHNPGVRDALWTSLKAGLGATAIAIVLGSLAAAAVARYKFFGREAVSFLVLLPIALPGIVTGMALNATFREVLEPFGVGLGLFTVIVGHATFCIVVIFNNVVARLRRTSRSFEEASADLGASSFQTFRYITLPALRSALVAGALLAFALSFDEVIVTTFTAGAQQTLPIWILTNLSRPNQLPIVNVVGVVVILLSAVPVYLAYRLTRDEAVSLACPPPDAVELALFALSGASSSRSPAASSGSCSATCGCPRRCSWRPRRPRAAARTSRSRRSPRSPPRSCTSARGGSTGGWWAGWRRRRSWAPSRAATWPGRCPTRCCCSSSPACSCRRASTCCAGRSSRSPRPWRAPATGSTCAPPR